MAYCRWTSSSLEYSVTFRRFNQSAVLSNSVSQAFSVAAASTPSVSTSVTLMNWLLGATIGGGLSFLSSVMDASRDKKVFVHCAANYRVSSFVALYHEARQNWSPQQGDAHMRRVWEPNETWTRFIAESRARQSTPPPERP